MSTHSKGDPPVARHGILLKRYLTWNPDVFQAKACKKKKNRSAMRTCVAYEIELLFNVWCLIGFLLEELISDYH